MLVATVIGGAGMALAQATPTPAPTSPARTDDHLGRASPALPVPVAVRDQTRHPPVVHLPRTATPHPHFS